MKIINLSLDHKILDKDSEVFKRAKAYAALVEKYRVIVPGKNGTIKVSEKFEVVGFKGTNKFFSLLKVYQYLKQLLVKEKFDLITVQDVYYLALVAKLIAKKYNLKLEVQVHGLEKFTGLRKLIAGLTIRSADQVRVVNRRLRRKIVEEFKISEDKIKVVPIFINADRITATPVKIDLRAKYPDDFIFLTVGRLVLVKNIGLQLRALARLPKDLAVKLIIVGDGPKKTVLKKLAKSLAIESKVKFVGQTDDLASYYKSADCFLLTSDSEGYGLVAGEALVAGLPIIMTDVGCAGELVKDNINGLVINVNDLDQLVDSMKKIMEDKLLREKFRLNNLDKKDRIPDKQKLINQTVNNWQEIIGL